VAVEVVDDRRQLETADLLGLELRDMHALVALDVALDQAVLVRHDPHGGGMDGPQLDDVALAIGHLVDIRVAGDRQVGDEFVEHPREALGRVRVLQPALQVGDGLPLLVRRLGVFV